jgi:hypothetical protein
MTEIATTKPKLTLGIKAPMRLEAYKAKIKFVDPKPVEVLKPVEVPKQVEPPKLVEVSKPVKKKRELANVSALPWPSRSELFPAVDVPGTPLSFDPAVAEDRQRMAAEIPPKGNATLGARFWARRVAFEVAEQFPDRREEAELFALRHRLGIAAAFHRRLKRADVVSWLREAFVSHHQAGISADGE